MGAVPLERRSNGPSIQESQIMALLQSQNLTASTRAVPKALMRPYLLRHSLPLSSAASRSAYRPATSTGASSSSNTGSSMDRISQAVRMRTTLFNLGTAGESNAGAATVRENRAPEAQPQTAEPYYYEAVEDEPTLQAQEEEEPIPHYYEGTDTDCSICRCQLGHGERVCRLGCRHVFPHSMLEQPPRASEGRTCPNRQGKPRRKT